MVDMNEFLYGKDYSEKIKRFNEAVELIHNNYKGNFDTTGYFMMVPTNEGKIIFSFDKEKEIPVELEEKVRDAFNKIFKY